MRSIFAAVVAGFLFVLPMQSQALTFKIATAAPDGTAWMEKMRAGADEVAKRTDGRVRFRFYPGGIMGSDKAVLRKIRIGQLHGGAITGGGLAEIYPDANVYSLPFAFHSYEEVDYVRQRMDSVILNDLRNQGFISPGLIEGGFAYLMSDAAIRDVADLKQKKVWIPDGDVISRTAFEALGVSPISLPLTDVLTALQTGLVDTIGANSVGAIALQWHTRVKYMTDLPLMYLYGTLVIKRSVFERLNAQDQATVMEVMGRVTKELDTSSREDDQKARAALLQQGIKVVATSPQQAQQWRAAVGKAVAQLTQRGAFSDAMLANLQTPLVEFRRRQ